MSVRTRPGTVSAGGAVRLRGDHGVLPGHPVVRGGGPNRRFAVAPILDRIVEERHGELKLVKVNIDEEPEIAERYGIASIPTMVLFKDGEPAAAAIGAQPKGALEMQLGLTPAETNGVSS